MSELRNLRVEDAEQVAALFVEAFGDGAPARRGGDPHLDRQQGAEAGAPACPRGERRVVGYGDIWIEDDEVALDVAAPGHWEPFLDWAEAEARARGVAARAYFPAGHELEQIVARAATGSCAPRTRWRSTCDEAAAADAARRPLAPVLPGRGREVAARCAERVVQGRLAPPRRVAVELHASSISRARLRPVALAARLGRRRARRLRRSRTPSASATEPRLGRDARRAPRLAPPRARRGAAARGVRASCSRAAAAGSASASTPRT